LETKHWPIRAEGKYELTTIRHEITIDKRNFKVCEPKEVRARHYLVSQNVYIVHVTRKGKMTIRKLK